MLYSSSLSIFHTLTLRVAFKLDHLYSCMYNNKNLGASKDYIYYSSPLALKMYWIANRNIQCLFQCLGTLNSMHISNLVHSCHVLTSPIRRPILLCTLSGRRLMFYLSSRNQGHVRTETKRHNEFYSIFHLLGFQNKRRGCVG